MTWAVAREGRRYSMRDTGEWLVKRPGRSPATVRPDRFVVDADGTTMAMKGGVGLGSYSTMDEALSRYGLTRSDIDRATE